MNRGLSLVEMAIVVTIIALIVGAIMNGKNLIHTSQLQSTVADVNRFKSAINTFYAKYNAYPGDINNAATTSTGLWTLNSSTIVLNTSCIPGSFTSYAYSTTTTCNGDGGGYVSSNSGAAGEEFLFWQHLAFAGLIPGAGFYVAGEPTTTSTAPYIPNLPESKITQGYYRFYYQNVYNITAQMFLLSSITATSSSVTSSALLSTNDAYALDQKADDGVPNTGTILGINASGQVPGPGTGATATCVTTNTSGYTAGSTVENYCTNGSNCNSVSISPAATLCELLFLYP